ncbi:hypothetical protein [Streptomyces sp. NPDC053431]|uniref:hypothetical protein n=1 Tax=Streptomyces sp. NPDC053431 TaxID=3365703 RepID=UPI0037CD4EC2
MEQRTGPSIQTVPGVATDPASVPGITGPRPAEAGEGPAAPEDARVASAEQAASRGKAVAEDAVAEHSVGDSAEDSVETSEGDDVQDAAEDAVSGGPVFEAADRRARIVADAAGVRLSLDEESCEFRWDEIGAVETASPRFGKRLRVVVHTPDRRWYPIEIEAPARGRVQEWESLLDAVLDVYFDENA